MAKYDYLVIGAGFFGAVFAREMTNRGKRCLEKKSIPCNDPQNLEEWALDVVGRKIYETFIREYTKKQRNKDPKEVSPFLIKRLPIRFSFKDAYYNDQYSGIRWKGKNLLKGIEGRLNKDYLKIGKVPYYPVNPETMQFRINIERRLKA